MNHKLPLSLYVHLPWCVRKCPYCDFNSHTAGDAPPRDRYLEALRSDMRAEAAAGRSHGRRIETVFIGGGTPSLFSGAEIRQIIDDIRETFDLADDAEITLEANPGTTESDNLANYRLAGVNRLSLGAQSFDDESLRRLGRIHGSAEIVAAVQNARDAGFDNINLDLMYALPGQSPEQACADLERAVELTPAHISWYQLTLEPNTVFFSRPPADLPQEDDVWEIQSRGEQLLGEAGYDRYEISAYARNGMRCRHNLNYWTFGDYLAIGAGAHAKFTDEAGRIWRYAKPAHPMSYMTSPADYELRAVSDADASFEYMLNTLRLPGGFSEESFRDRTGQDFGIIADGIGRATELGLLKSPGAGNWQPTSRGLRFLNDLQGLFLPPSGGSR